MNKTFSLRDFIKDLLALVDGAELSWDFKLDAGATSFTISVPIKLYGNRQKALRVQVKDVAEKHGLTVSTVQFRTLGDDFTLRGEFSDIKADRL